MAKSYENPLLPHSRIRELFRAMIEAEALPSPSADSSCAIALTIGLRDLDTSNICAPDLSLHPPLGLALGLTMRRVQRGTVPDGLQSQLNGDPLEQLYFALGTAVRSASATVILLAGNSLASRQWQRFLQDAAHLNAPVVVAALPSAVPGVAALATRCGVPGIPVDAADPIALYRVVGESIGRACAGGGPALIETLRLTPSADARALLRRQMIARGAASERWASNREQRAHAGTGWAAEQVH